MNPLRWLICFPGAMLSSVIGFILAEAIVGLVLGGRLLIGYWGLLPLIIIAAMFYRRSAFSLGIVVAFTPLIAGCFLAPKYEYVRQKDSAVIELQPLPSDIAIYIDHVDGRRPLTAMGMGGSRRSDKVYIAPGEHTLDLGCYQSEQVFPHGELGYAIIQGGGDVHCTLVSNGRYVISASLHGKVFNVVLWDETQGLSKRTKVGDWNFKGDLDYQSSP